MGTKAGNLLTKVMLSILLETRDLNKSSMMPKMEMLIVDIIVGEGIGANKTVNGVKGCALIELNESNGSKG